MKINRPIKRTCPRCERSIDVRIEKDRSQAFLIQHDDGDGLTECGGSGQFCDIGGTKRRVVTKDE